MSVRALVDDAAILDDEEDDESFDEETGEVRIKANGTNGHYDDSSEEEEDDDEEEAAKVSMRCLAIIGISLANIAFLPRLPRASLLTKKKRTRKPGRNEGASGRKENESSASVRMRVSTRKTWT